MQLFIVEEKCNVSSAFIQTYTAQSAFLQQFDYSRMTDSCVHEQDDVMPQTTNQEVGKIKTGIWEMMTVVSDGCNFSITRRWRRVY